MKLRWIFLILLVPMMCFRASASEETNAPAPVTARDFYNAGTRLLSAGKFSEAEGFLHSAIAAQDPRVQPHALYNLGETRFAEGTAMLKKGPKAQSALARGRNTVRTSEQVLQQGRNALANKDLGGMIRAYIAGHGARKQVREAEKAVKAAMETYGDTMRKWQRAADDFKSAAELNPADTNATHNALLVEQHIARLVDSVNQMRQMLGMLGNLQQRLNQMLSRLQGQVPQLNGPPGKGGAGSEGDEGLQPDALVGHKENPGREGKRMRIPLSPEMAAHLLDGLSLNGGRQLPMEETNTSQISKHPGRTW